jgi:lycopene cyclase domain-containing protein
VNFLYLAALLVSLTGMVMLDRKFALFFWADALRASIVLTVGVVFFLLWDSTGIAAGVFFRGEGPYMTGLVIGPELPIEEVFFLTLLSYMTMNVYAAISRALTSIAGTKAQR